MKFIIDNGICIYFVISIVLAVYWFVCYAGELNTFLLDVFNDWKREDSLIIRRVPIYDRSAVLIILTIVSIAYGIVWAVKAVDSLKNFVFLIHDRIIELYEGLKKRQRAYRRKYMKEVI